jgi:hypothetical protein
MQRQSNQRQLARHSVNALSEVQNRAQAKLPSNPRQGAAIVATTILARRRSNFIAPLNILAIAISTVAFGSAAHQFAYFSSLHLQLRKHQLEMLEMREEKLKAQIAAADAKNGESS